MKLVDANLRCHLWLDERWLDFMEYLLAADYDEAGRQLARFQGWLLAHAAFEDEEVLPRFSALDEGDATAAHIAGDHTVLRRVLAAASRQLESLRDQGAPLRQIASVLEPFVRVQSVLSHHTEREQNRFYSLLDERLDAAERAEVALGLLDTVGLRPDADCLGSADQ